MLPYNWFINKAEKCMIQARQEKKVIPRQHYRADTMDKERIV